MHSITKRSAILFSLTATTLLTSALHAQPRSKQMGEPTRFHNSKAANPRSSEAPAATPQWENQKMTLDRDTCLFAVLHHSRQVYQSLSQSENRLKALVGQSSKSGKVDWIEKPQLLRKESKDKVESALRAVQAAKKEVADLAGRGKSYSYATIIAQRSCEEGLVLGSAGNPGLLTKSTSAVAKAETQVRGLFDNGYVDMKQTNFEGFSELFLAPLNDAQNNVNQLGAAVTAPAKKRAGGLLGTSNPHEKQKSAITKLDKELRKKYPVAFEGGEVAKGSEEAKQMLAVNTEVSDFLRSHPIGYGDAARLWKMDLIRQINVKGDPKGSAGFVDDLIVDIAGR